MIKCHIPKYDNYIYCNMGAVCGNKFNESTLVFVTILVYILDFLTISTLHSVSVLTRRTVDVNLDDAIFFILFHFLLIGTFLI